MKNQPILYGIMGVLAGSLLTLLFVSSSFRNNNYGMMQKMGFRQFDGANQANNIDKHFIEQMIPHHEGAIEMAKLAQEKSNRPEVLTLASTIIDSQSTEITQMQSWYKEWYGSDVPFDSTIGMGMGRGMMHGGMMGGQTSDIESLKSATDFDKAFVEEMIPHHQMAVMMTQMLQSGTDRSEMKQLALDIIKAQEAEIELMRTWLREW